jgi:hypothetical protein
MPYSRSPAGRRAPSTRWPTPIASSNTIPDAIDDCGPTVFGRVAGTTELDEMGLQDWLMPIIAPFGGNMLM